MSRLVQARLMFSVVFVSSLSLFPAHSQGLVNGKHQPQPRGKHVDRITVTQLSKQPEVTYSWGVIHWLLSNKIDFGANQTFGIVRIDAGKTNPLHLHPNCEELMYILSGTGTTRIDDKVVSLQPGELVRIPAGVFHQATASGSAPLVAVISYSSGDRQVVVNGAAHE